MTAKRIFIAIDISNKARESATAYINALRADFWRINVGWEHPEKLHFTIRFLGETDEDQLHRVLIAVEKTAHQHQPCQVRIVNTGVFPHPKKPKVLWLGVKQGEDEIVKTNKDLESGLQTAGFAPESRRFHPHLTIARIRDQIKSRELVRVHKQRQFEPIEFTARGLTIYESKLQKTGSVYSSVRFFPFAHK